jgi:hyperosmotically inducible protein
MRKAIAVLSLSLLLLTTVLAGQDTPPAKPKPKPKPAVDCSTVGDAAITQDVQGRLSKAASLKDFNITAATSGGVVTLTGTVKTSRNKATATRVAKAAPCVKKVDNQLTVEMPSAPSKKS